MPRIAGPDPTGLPAVVTRAEALAAGLTPGRIGWLVDSGRWTVLSRGIYLRGLESPCVGDPHTATDLHHVRRAASASMNRQGSVIMRSSAALRHGLPLVSGTPAMVELAVPRSARREERRGVRTRLASVPEHDIVTVPVEGLGGRAVTSVARTWVDIARFGTLADSLSVGDAALRRGLISTDDARASSSAWAP